MTLRRIFAVASPLALVGCAPAYIAQPATKVATLVWFGLIACTLVASFAVDGLKRLTAPFIR